MFGFLTSGAKEVADPLVIGEVRGGLAAPAARARCHRPPAARHAGVRRACASRAGRSISRASQAIEFLDAALGADRRQLIKQYVENYDSAPKLAERIWQAIYDLSQGFMYAYQTALEEALRAVGQRALEAACRRCCSRASSITTGTDAKLRVFRFERWIPAKWMELHRTYLRAIRARHRPRAPRCCTSAGPERDAMDASSRNTSTCCCVHQLNTGNMSPPELDWAMSQLRAWSRRLAARRGAALARGLLRRHRGQDRASARRTGNDSGSMLRYLDTTPLAESLERAIAALRQAETTDQGPAAPINQQRIAILEKVRPSVSPNLNSRAPARSAHRVRGRRARCASAWRASATSSCTKDGVDAAATPMRGSEQIEVFAVADGSRASRRRVPDEHDSLAASLSSFSDPMWQVKDRSVAGLRIAASGGIGQALALGALVAVRQSDLSDWVLGVVRRLNKVSNDEVEAGMSIIADRFVPVTLHARARRRRTTWASSSTASTCRRWARASTACTCRRRRVPTSRSRSRR